ncbi:hypothetical protein CPB84DRAFT_1795294 [Gymnopilus junonius]|uniref:Uncharacterized protein n=1 Tax=Gymnopilus junonius TaxID=109634 RepID=A0A9P5THL7_GYMJU|nr:hypothetical protein CPB84DRAFT_1795294 [Gymnopilus junonius]
MTGGSLGVRKTEFVGVVGDDLTSVRREGEEGEASGVGDVTDKDGGTRSVDGPRSYMEPNVGAVSSIEGLADGALVALAPPRRDIDPEAEGCTSPELSLPRSIICDEVDPVCGFVEPPWDISSCCKLLSGAAPWAEVKLDLILAKISIDPCWSFKL